LCLDKYAKVFERFLLYTSKAFDTVITVYHFSNFRLHEQNSIILYFANMESKLKMLGRTYTLLK